jgi:hypothetical protein
LTARPALLQVATSWKDALAKGLPFQMPLLPGSTQPGGRLTGALPPPQLPVLPPPPPLEPELARPAGCRCSGGCRPGLLVWWGLAEPAAAHLPAGSVPWHHPSTSQEQLLYAIFRDLHSKG